ncbi:choice-of-anchor M domain-containing protein [Corynebacterium pelargi]|uniref:Uncharacterized protein n=1 Tax=Corynebacterium pelargi TaxID=1471400 RepID=A0A410W6K3_9CORY|nr:choice-of-anchor M domain-containing protein [Corynebacterium pelargi]QAU51582.1 hypothetical protein CPELA_01410 [Corynebacterium pelargi]GGG82493.1 hypothetical protein GCM10007338_21780 [Corynebacterium pelargi]
MNFSTFRTRMRPRMLGLIGAVALLAALLLPGPGLNLIRLVDESTQVGTHRPGTGDALTSLPPDQPFFDAEGRDTGELHPCAGRDLLYHAHVDAGYVTRNERGELDVMAVNNTKVIPQDSACMRLGPDSFNGVEVSRFVVPQDPALSFLGAPGSIVWRAPFENYGWKWLPIWAGLGAFDGEHEWKVPTDFVANAVQLELVDFEGPGEMNIYNYLPTWDRAARIIGSKDLRTTTLRVGGHGHMNWAFSQPGIYKLSWQAQGRHYDGSVERSAPVTQYWLVGEDSQVGLLPGTSRDLGNYGKRAETLREEMGLSEPSGALAEAVMAEQAPKLKAEDVTAMVEDQFYNSTAPISSGDVVFNVGYSGKELLQEAEVTLEPQVDAKHIEGAVVIEVPDSAAKCIAADDPYLSHFARAAGSRLVWMTGEPGGNTPSFGFDTSGLDLSQLSEQQVVVEPGVTAPRGGVFAIGAGQGEHFAPIATNANSNSSPLQLLGAQRHHLQYMMSAPGIYSEDGSVQVFHKTDPRYDFYSPIFLVGNQVINEWRKRAGVEERLPETQPTCATAPPVRGIDPFTPELVDAPEDPENLPEETAAPEEPEQPQEPEQPVEEEPSPSPSATETPEASALHRIQLGHLDMALGTLDGSAIAYLKDESDPANPVRRESGTFSIVVPQRAWHKDASVLELEDFADGAFVLPEVQDRRLPWPGVSNEAFDFSAVHPEHPTTDFSIASVLNAPEGGRLVISGTEDMKVKRQLDSADPSASIALPAFTHAHKAFWFNKPGTYEVRFAYSWINQQGATEQVFLDTTFEVGTLPKEEEPQPQPTQQPAQPTQQPAKPQQPTHPAKPQAQPQQPAQPAKPQAQAPAPAIAASPQVPPAQAPAAAPARPAPPRAAAAVPKAGSTPAPPKAAAIPRPAPPLPQNAPLAQGPKPPLSRQAAQERSLEVWRGVLLGVGGFSLLLALVVYLYSRRSKTD